MEEKYQKKIADLEVITQLILRSFTCYCLDEKPGADRAE
jgi:hypothetical protein